MTRIPLPTPGTETASLSGVEGVLPLTVLVQGGIASGKSTVARRLAALGGAQGEYVDCDALAHQALTEPEVIGEVREAFGEGVLTPAGSVDRKAMADLVFHDEAALARLEAIVHPRVVAAVRARIEASRVPPGTPRRVLVIDAAVASRMKMAEEFDLTLFVDVRPDIRSRRAQELRGWAPGELERREARQAPLDIKRSQADAVVPNDADLEEAERHVERFWTEHVQPRL